MALKEAISKILLSKGLTKEQIISLKKTKRIEELEENIQNLGLLLKNKKEEITDPEIIEMINIVLAHLRIEDKNYQVFEEIKKQCDAIYRYVIITKKDDANLKIIANIAEKIERNIDRLKKILDLEEKSEKELEEILLNIKEDSEKITKSISITNQLLLRLINNPQKTDSERLLTTLKIIQGILDDQIIQAKYCKKIDMQTTKTIITFLKYFRNKVIEQKNDAKEIDKAIKNGDKETACVKAIKMINKSLEQINMVIKYKSNLLNKKEIELKKIAKKIKVEKYRIFVSVAMAQILAYVPPLTVMPGAGALLILGFDKLLSMIPLLKSISKKEVIKIKENLSNLQQTLATATV